MTSRRYDYIKGLNGHFEFALYVDTFEEVDESYKNALENGAESVLALELEPWGSTMSSGHRLWTDRSEAETNEPAISQIRKGI